MGGEQSGHIIFSKYATTGDGILTILKIMQAIIDKKSTLSQLVAPMRVYPQVLKSVRVKNKTAARTDKRVCKAVESIEKRLDNSGRILVRESGTEPVIRVMVEAESLEICQTCVEEIMETIKRGGHASSD